MQLTNQEEKHRAAVNLSWSRAKSELSELHQAFAFIKAACTCMYLTCTNM